MLFIVAWYNPRFSQNTRGDTQESRDCANNCAEHMYGTSMIINVLLIMPDWAGNLQSLNTVGPGFCSTSPAVTKSSLSTINQKSRETGVSLMQQSHRTTYMQKRDVNSMCYMYAMINILGVDKKSAVLVSSHLQRNA